jgi:hypothetical protein
MSTALASATSSSAAAADVSLHINFVRDSAFAANLRVQQQPGSAGHYTLAPAMKLHLEPTLPEEWCTRSPLRLGVHAYLGVKRTHKHTHQHQCSYLASHVQALAAPRLCFDTY